MVLITVTGTDTTACSGRITFLIRLNVKLVWTDAQS